MFEQEEKGLGKLFEEIAASIEDDDESLDLLDAEEDEQVEPETEEKQAEPKQQEKLIPQSKVNKIVEDRLARYKKKAQESASPYFKFIEEHAKEYGMTPDEYIAAVSKTKVRESVQEKAEELGMTPDEYIEIEEAKRKAEAYDKQQLESKAQAERNAAFEKHVKEFNKKHPNVDVAKLAGNEEFMSFIADLNPNLSLAQRYDKYVEYKGAEKAKILLSQAQKEERSTHAGPASKGRDFGLTEIQKELAIEAGMSFEEYHNRLMAVKAK